MALIGTMSQSDENKWQEAVENLVEQSESGDEIFRNKKGETVLKMTACIAITKKRKRDDYERLVSTILIY